MAAKQDGWTDLIRLFAFSAAILVPLVGSILYQGSILRSEIRDLRTEMHTEFQSSRTEVRTEIRNLRSETRTEVGDLRSESSPELRAKVGGLRGKIEHLCESVARLEAAVARIEAWRSLRLMLAMRFAASGEGARYGGATIAAGLLLVRALPEIHAKLSTIDQDAQRELAEDLWEDRANILARANPLP